MANEAFCRAIHEIAGRLFPEGFDVSDAAPNSFLDLALHVARTGRMVVTSHMTDDNQFDTPETYHAFRAWHDWCHIQGGHPFTLNGECATVRIQFAMLAALYGPARTREWSPILRRQIIHDNFGEGAACLDALPSGD